MNLFRFPPGLGLVCALWGAASAQAQNLLPNGTFEEGDAQPKGWRLVEGAGEWGNAAHGGHRGVTVRGKGEEHSSWRAEGVRLTPGGLYRLQFWGRREPGAAEGTAVSGSSRVNRDFPLDEEWRLYRFIFTVPVDGGADYIRLGQWHVKGGVQFDDASLTPVQVAHGRGGGGSELGEGESIQQGRYHFRADLGWLGANYHRPLATNRAGFNSNRWLFSPGAEVVYRHSVAGHLMKSAKVIAGINHHQGGTLSVEASQDGTGWTMVGEYGAERRGGATDLPASLFPASQVFVRLSQAGPGAGFQVDTYELEAALDGTPADLEGETHFLAVTETSPQLGAGFAGQSIGGTPTRLQVSLALTNQTQSPLSVVCVLPTSAVTAVAAAALPPPSAGERSALQFTLKAAETRLVELRSQVLAQGDHQLAFQLTTPTGAVLFAGEADARFGFLEDSSFGHRLSGPAELGLWWCESGWKVGRERALPSASAGSSAPGVRVAAARGEYEAAQVVLRPSRNAGLELARVSPFRRKGGETGSITARVDEVAYVRVTRPTDASCRRGWYPDPLPPLRPPLALPAGQNQPLWITFKIAPETKAGDYEAKLELRTSLGAVTVPLSVHVWDFELPRDTHLHSALGLGSHEINRHHRLSEAGQKRAVFEKYLLNFAEHRISPYSFYDYAPIDVRFVGEGTNKQAQVDFSQFDQAAATWLDGHRFNTFQLPLQGMGGGTFQSRYLGELAGFKEGTPEHARLFHDYLSQVERHLRERGWLNQAFTYWFDEPDPKDYEFVVEGMKRLKAAAPGIRRMLTEQPEPALMGHVEIWCGLTPEWTPEQVRARRQAGEEVWWYICTGPKAPYVTEFIDHPGTELRLWPWQSWQYGVSGILVWATIYWSSPLVYPEPKVQDPWTDPMSWVSGYGLPVGHISPWGNGDGRFLYPPRRDPNASTEPCLDGPINSLRWENLRDGMEDYEYFWLLAQAIERVKPAKGETPLVTEARALLKVPAGVSKDLTHFTLDPRPLLEHRARVARMIEKLRTLPSR